MTFKLPKLIATSVVRGSQQGESHATSRSASRSTEFSNIGSRSKKQQHNEPTSVSLLLRIIPDQPKD